MNEGSLNWSECGMEMVPGCRRRANYASLSHLISFIQYIRTPPAPASTFLETMRDFFNMTLNSGLEAFSD